MPQITMSPPPNAPVIFGTGDTAQGLTQHFLFRKLVQMAAKTFLASATVLTDNSGGVVASPVAIVQPATLADVVAAGSNLADPVTTEASLTEILNATASLFSVVNGALTKLGYPTVAYTGGGVVTDPIAAIAVAVTGETTGVPSASLNVIVANLAEAQYQLGITLNRIAIASGASGDTSSGSPGKYLTIGWQGVNETVAGIGPISLVLAGSLSTAAAATAVTAVLTTLRNNVSNLAATYTAAIAGAQKPLILCG